MANDNSTRRDMVRGLGVGIAATVAAPAFAADSGKDADVSSLAAPAAGLSDPRKAYPQPPFRMQSQAWPGLQGKMTPMPDCGEASYKGAGRLTGRKALVTGGDSGIGRAAAIAYAREGADVAICYLPAEEPDAKVVVDLVRQAGRKAVAIPGDIRDEGFCSQLVTRAVQELGGLDILVNNAARQQERQSILDITTEEFDWTMRTNLYGMFWITKAALPHMPAGAAIVNTTSVNAYNPSQILLDYSMTKGAIMIFTKALAKQLVDKGIRVNAVAPGPFWTPLQVSGGQTQENLAKFGAETPLGRPGQPVELAGIYVELADARSSYVTGQVIGATGGTGMP